MVPVQVERNLFRFLFAAVLTTTFMFNTPGALAQDSDQETNASEEDAESEDEETFIITARRREESAQDVPIAVSSYSGDTLEKWGAVDLTDIQDLTPNTTLEVSRGTNSTITAFIRGVGQQDPVAGFESGVGIYIDDVYLNRPQAAVLDIYDVERIEVLRGPQGTLYGRNTIGGAVRYVTRRFSGEPAFRARVNGGTFGQRDFIATGEMPLTDELTVGGTFAYFRREGFGDNLNLGIDNYDKNILAGRLSVEWTPTDDLFIRVTGDITDDNSNPRQGHRLLPGDPFFPGFPVLDDVYDTYAGLNVVNQSVESRGVSGQVEWYVNDQITLKNIVAYRADETTTPIDFDSLPVADLDVPAIYENDQLSEELQLIYEGDRVQGVVGFYYLEADAFNTFDVLLAELGDLLSLPGLNATTTGDVSTETWSVFGDFSYDLTDTVSVSAGGRFTSDERSSTILRETYLFGFRDIFGGSPVGPIATTSDFQGTKTFEEFTPRFSVTWEPNREHTFYVSYAQGFKSGSFDPRCASSAAPDLDGDGLSGADDYDDQFEFCLFEPEKIATYEAGWKSTTFGGRLRSALAVFYSEYDNVQIPGSVGIDTDGDGVNDTFAGVTTNAGAATLMGVEFEGSALVATDSLTPGDSLSFFWAGGWIDAKYDEFFVNDVNLASSRNFQNTPEVTATGIVSYTHPLRILGDGELAWIGSAAYRSDTHQFEFNSPLDQDAYTLFNASLVWRSDDAHWEFGVHGKNLTDEEYIVAGYDFVTATNLGLSNVLTAFYGNPRTVTATVAYSY